MSASFYAQACTFALIISCAADETHRFHVSVACATCVVGAKPFVPNPLLGALLPALALASALDAALRTRQPAVPRPRARATPADFAPAPAPQFWCAAAMGGLGGRLCVRRESAKTR